MRFKESETIELKEVVIDDIKNTKYYLTPNPQ